MAKKVTSLSKQRAARVASARTPKKRPVPARQTDQRARVPSALPKPRKVEFPYAKKRETLKSLDLADLLELVIETDAWKTIAIPWVERFEAARRRKRKRQSGPECAYSAIELERLLFYKAVGGFTTVAEALDALELERNGRVRVVLGFDRPRSTPRTRGTSRRRRDGIPSEATVCRYLAAVSESERLRLYRKLDRALTRDLLAHPQMQEASRTLNLDGTPVRTHYTAPKYDKKSKELVNADRVSAPDAGYVPGKGDKAGNGWQFVGLVTGHGVTVGNAFSALNESEPEEAHRALREYELVVKPSLPPKQLSLVNGDGAFHSPRLQGRMRELTMIENIHLASHGNSEESQRNVAKKNTQRLPLKGAPTDENDKPLWYANGHRELLCACGALTTSKRYGVDGKGHAYSRVEARCPNCGSYSVTSAGWRITDNSKSFRRMQPHDPPDVADFALGNGLTYNDKLAEVYGSNRFGHQEGFHGQLTTRFKLKQHKRWYRRKNQVEIDARMAFSFMKALALHSYASADVTRGSSPPLAVAA